MKTRADFGKIPRPVVRWYPSEQFCDIEAIYYSFVKSASQLLDFGAGDLSLKKKFLDAGFQGNYFTCDVSRNYRYDFQSIDEVVNSGRIFDAVIVLEVIEHMTLDAFERFFPKLLSVIAPGGRLILSTSNAMHINGTWAGDITHVKTYPQADLWALLTLKGFNCVPYRIVWLPKHLNPLKYAKYQINRILTHLLGVDYAVGICLLCTKNL
ncbi:MAG: class I SAM-dependent methyltransferase [Deltaproteobacteria bacterium]|nr:class I SAM-dependent methyltransferase [Deltaproteobacteria bacterium]